jgi:hypothetical protein
MRSLSIPLLTVFLVTGAAGIAAGTPAAPFDEETLDQIDALNRAITSHYEELQETARDLEARRAIARSKLEAIEEDLANLERERAQFWRGPESAKEPGLRLIEEHRIEAKSRYLEALAEKHAIDLEATHSFEIHASAILINLERLAEALERSGRLSESADEEDTREAFYSLQRGTAIALSVLEEWGTLTRDDPRFRALWATARVLNRNVRRLQASEGIRVTVDLVRERNFVVRSLIDQARALRSALDHQGLLLQVAAQNQMLRLHFTRLGAINGLELPDLHLEDSTRRILEDIEEEPFAVSARDSEDAVWNGGLGGFDECAQRGICR